MDNFLQLHQDTLVGVLVSLTILIVIALVGYAFIRCWCTRLHQLCGAGNRDIEINEGVNGHEKADNTGIVFKGKAKSS